jgi:hypothetical protein
VLTFETRTILDGPHWPRYGRSERARVFRLATAVVFAVVAGVIIDAALPPLER